MTTTDGIEGVLIDTHNWGKTVAFWKALGYELEFETDHHSGRLRHPRGGPYLFVAERPAGALLQFQLVLAVRDAAKFAPPGSGQVVRPFEAQHWGVLELALADPDGRQLSVQAPLPQGIRKESRHG
jgi:catechol 2,3-dioxygenase-like lactoylglutathione lyase family enzyme